MEEGRENEISSLFNLSKDILANEIII